MGERRRFCRTVSFRSGGQKDEATQRREVSGHAPVTALAPPASPPPPPRRRSPPARQERGWRVKAENAAEKGRKKHGNAESPGKSVSPRCACNRRVPGQRAAAARVTRRREPPPAVQPPPRWPPAQTLQPPSPPAAPARRRAATAQGAATRQSSRRRCRQRARPTSLLRTRPQFRHRRSAPARAERVRGDAFVDAAAQTTTRLSSSVLATVRIHSSLAATNSKRKCTPCSLGTRWRKNIREEKKRENKHEKWIQQDIHAS